MKWMYVCHQRSMVWVDSGVESYIDHRSLFSTKEFYHKKILSLC